MNQPPNRSETETNVEDAKIAGGRSLVYGPLVSTVAINTLLMNIHKAFNQLKLDTPKMNIHNGKLYLYQRGKRRVEIYDANQL